MATARSLLDLPADVLDYLLAFLHPVGLASIAGTCRTLYALATQERHWAAAFRALELPNFAALPAPFGSFRELYAAHHPYWFLPGRRLWFTDGGARGDPNGKLLVARYDHRLGLIEAYELLAHRSGAAADYPPADPLAALPGPFALHDPVAGAGSPFGPDALFPFFPRVRPYLDDPVLRLDPAEQAAAPPRDGGGRHGRRGRFDERAVPTRADSVHARLLPAVALPAQRAAQPTTVVWPPRTLPAAARVHRDSPSRFRDAAHRPRRAHELCPAAFRTRRWMAFGLAVVRMGESVLTWAALPPACWVPDRDHPYRGLWVGDYGPHGCELLVVLQGRGPEGAQDGGAAPEPEAAAGPRTEDAGAEGHDAAAVDPESGEPPPAPDDPPGESGHLEAVKLTGDPHVPRGERTWVAREIGRAGTLRTAAAPPFRGARVVRSHGHLADWGFQNDRFEPAQLMLVSHDLLLQYWETLEHVSTYRRVDVDRFLNFDEAG